MQDTIAVLGAGLNLGWLAAPWLQERSVAYWGDLDTWGLHMLAIGRHHLPHLQALLMDAATFSAHQHLAVAEPVHAPNPHFSAQTPEEAALASTCVRKPRAARAGVLAHRHRTPRCANLGE